MAVPLASLILMVPFELAAAGPANIPHETTAVSVMVLAAMNPALVPLLILPTNSS